MVKVLVKILKLTSPVMALVLRFKVCNERSSDSSNHIQFICIRDIVPYSITRYIPTVAINTTVLLIE